jgi:hypothetical protein
MKNPHKNTLILFILACNLIYLPTYSLGADPHIVEPVSSFFSEDLLVGQNYSWKVQEWYQMEDWLRYDTTYEPKSGDIWNMTIIGDLSQVILTITALDFFEIKYDPYPKFSEYLQFSISGHTFDEVFGNPDEEEYNWLMLSKLFLIPYTIEDNNGDVKNFSSFYKATFEDIVGEADIDTGSGDLFLSGTLEGQYESEIIELDCKLGIRESFSYKKTSVETNLITGEIKLIIEQNEFDPTPPDDEDDDSDKVDSPFDISSYPLLIGLSILTVIILVKAKKKQLHK